MAAAAAVAALPTAPAAAVASASAAAAVAGGPLAAWHSPLLVMPAGQQGTQLQQNNSKQSATLYMHSTPTASAIDIPDIIDET
jgi:hypothetical protein